MAASPASTELPHGVSLEAFAEISAAVTEAAEPLPALLSARGLGVAAYKEVSDHYARVLAADAAADGPLMDLYTRAFAAAQDRLRPLPDLDVERWAELSEAFGALGEAALEGTELRGADMQRLARHWARALGSDPSAAKRYHAAFLAAARRRVT